MKKGNTHFKLNKNILIIQNFNSKTSSDIADYTEN